MAMINRRELFQRGLHISGGVALLGGLPALLAACGSSKKSSSATVAPTTAGSATTAASATTGATATTTAAAGSSAATTGSAATSSAPASSAAPADLGTLNYRLSWIKNSEFAGAYLADANSYYKQQGFSSVNLIAGGPSAQPAEVDVSSGKALVGISAPDSVAQAISQGGKLTIIGAQYQKNPFAVMSLASSPIKTPQDMYGKKFGLQSANQTVWDAFVAASGIDDSKIIKFPAQFDPTPLVQGQCDCWFSFITNEPNLLKVQEVDTYTFLLADFGYPLVNEVLVVATDSITSKADELKAFLKGEIMGWHDVYKDPAKAAQLTVGTYGKDLGLDATEQTLEVRSENELIWTDDTKANGILTITDDLIAKNIDTLGKAGLKITADALFDLSLLKAVYAANPDLKTPPTAG
jgi:ABC-type nitrate/sulfonate/bicarbonate transport system substrate-binding protein